MTLLLSLLPATWRGLRTAAAITAAALLLLAWAANLRPWARAALVVAGCAAGAGAVLARPAGERARRLPAGDPDGRLLPLQLELGLEKDLPRTGGWAAAPDFLVALADLVRTHRPRLVVEAGSGVSTLVLAAALRRLGTGHAHSLDHEACYAGETRARLAEHGLAAWCTVHHAPLVDHPAAGRRRRWYDMADLPSGEAVDLLVVDGPPSVLLPEARYPALPLLHDRLAPGAIVLLDDVGRPGERRVVERWLREHPGWKVEWLPLEKGAALLRRAA